MAAAICCLRLKRATSATTAGVCFITAGPITKLFAWGGPVEGVGGPVQRGWSAIVGQEGPRLRPFKVGDVPIPMPANGLWYQNMEAVRVLLQSREEGAMPKHVLDAMRARHFLDITYQTMMQKVKMVDDAVAASEGRFSAEDIIEKRLQDRPAKDQADVVCCCAGRC